MPSANVVVCYRECPHFKEDPEMSDVPNCVCAKYDVLTAPGVVCKDETMKKKWCVCGCEWAKMEPPNQETGDAAQYLYCLKYNRINIIDTICLETVEDNDKHIDPTAIEKPFFIDPAIEIMALKSMAPPEHPYNNEGRKYDRNKPRWDLLPWDLVAETVQVLSYGAAKYEANNWQNVKNGQERYFAALMRHIIAYRKGEIIDPESGLAHLAHACCNLIFMHELENAENPPRA